MAEMETLKPTALQSGKNNKRELVLAARQAPRLKKLRDFVERLNKKEVMNFICFPNFPGKQQHLNVTNEKLVYCVRGESIFPYKINLKKVSEPFISPQYTRDFGAKTYFFHNPLYILHSYEHTTEFISKRASQHAEGSIIFLPVKCR